ncbi:UNVERIFIED_CONTAM: hypothetical protein FKN15_012311 [Acipenser sinensis]
MRRVEVLGSEVSDTLLDRLKKAEFMSLAVDESTDNTDNAQLCVSVRLFDGNCFRDEIDHHDLLVHNDVRWITKGKALNRFFDLKDEIIEFLNNPSHKNAELCNFTASSSVKVTNVMSDFLIKLKDNFNDRFQDFHVLKEVMMFARNPVTVSPESDFASTSKQLLSSVEEGPLQMELVDIQASSSLKQDLQNDGAVKFWTDHIQQMISAILDSKAGAEKIFLEFAKTKSLSDSTRRLLMNMLEADMIEKHGRVPRSSVRTKHALGFVTLLPYLKDPDSSNGYIDQDFTMLFGEDASGKFLVKWPTLFSPSVIADCKNLPPSAHLETLLSSAQHDSDDLGT